MKRSKKILITVIGFIIFAIIGGVMYVEYWLSNLMVVPGIQQTVETNTQDKTINVDKPKTPESDIEVISAGNSTEQQPNTDVAQANVEKNEITEPQNNNQQTNTSTAPANPIPAEQAPLNNKIASTIQQEVGAPVATTDLLKAGFIILKKLSKEEINFLFNFSNDSYTNEDLERVRGLLLSKLNAEEVQTLRALGAKYGKKLDILDPSVPIGGK